MRLTLSTIFIITFKKLENILMRKIKNISKKGSQKKLTSLTETNYVKNNKLILFVQTTNISL